MTWITEYTPLEDGDSEYDVQKNIATQLIFYVDVG